METTNAEEKGNVVAVKSTYVLVMCIIGLVVGTIFGLGLIVTAAVLLVLPGILLPSIVCYIFIVFGLIIAGMCYGIYIPQLVILASCPANLILRNGNVLTFWCGKKNGYLDFPSDQIATVTPATGIWNSNLIMLIIGHYDASLTFTTSTGEKYKVPYVRDVKTIATQIQSICHEIRTEAPQPAPQTEEPVSEQPAPQTEEPAAEKSEPIDKD